MKVFFIFFICCLSAIATVHSLKDGDFVSMARTRRTPGGIVRMRGYVGYTRKNGYPLAFAGGYAGARTEDIPAYAAPGTDEQEEPEEVVEQDEEEEPIVQDPAPAPEPAPPTKTLRPSKASKPPSRPVRPPPPPSSEDDDEEEEDDGEDFGPPPSFGSNGKGRGGATAIATSYSNGKGASANSHAIAYDGTFSGGKYKHRY